MPQGRRFREAFQQAARKTRKTLLVPFASVALLAGGCATAPDSQPSAVDRHDHAPAQVTAVMPGGQRPPLVPGSRTEELLARNALRPVNDNLPQDERIRRYMDQLCFTVADADAGAPATAQQKTLRLALEDLRLLPVMGAPLVAQAAAQNIEFCALESMHAGFGAQYLPGISAVMTTEAPTRAAMMLRVAHEIVHAVQDGEGLLTYYSSWDIDSRVARNLSVEAAAVTAELLIAFEAKLAGNPAVWDHIRTRYTSGVYSDAGIYTVIENTWQDARAAGLGGEAALAAAGTAAWERVFTNPGWRDFYLNMELAGYLRDIERGFLDNAREFRHDGFGPEKQAAAGRIGTGVSFTAAGNRPVLQDLLVRNPKMAWAYEAAEAERYRRVFGADDPRTQALRERALRRGNPYLDLDFSAVLRAADEAAFPKDGGPKKYRHLYEYMDDAAAERAARPRLSRPQILRPPAA